MVPDLANSVLGALVSITASCALVRPWEAVIVGSLGGLLGATGVRLLDHLRIDDPVGAVAVHGFAGLWVSKYIVYLFVPCHVSTYLQLVFKYISVSVDDNLLLCVCVHVPVTLLPVAGHAGGGAVCERGQDHRAEPRRERLASRRRPPLAWRAGARLRLHHRLEHVGDVSAINCECLVTTNF